MLPPVQPVGKIKMGKSSKNSSLEALVQQARDAKGPSVQVCTYALVIECYPSICSASV